MDERPDRRLRARSYLAKPFGDLAAGAPVTTVQPMRLQGYEQLLFEAPSGPGLYLSIAEGELARARELRSQVLASIMEKPNGTTVISDTARLFDFLEAAIAGVVFAYTSVEVFANQEIPDDAHFAWKGEELNRDAIERRVPLTEKLKHIVSAARGVATPAGTQLWQRFLEIENLRHSCVHSKSHQLYQGAEWETRWMEVLYARLLAYPPWEAADIARQLIAHYYPNDPPGWLLPEGWPASLEESEARRTADRQDT